MEQEVQQLKLELKQAKVEVELSKVEVELWKKKAQSTSDQYEERCVEGVKYLLELSKEVPMDDSKVWNIKKSWEMLGMTTKVQHLYVRKCYKDLHDRILKQVSKTSDAAWHVSGLSIVGTPGIGKTYFTLYLLLHLIRSQLYVIHFMVLNYHIIIPTKHSSIPYATTTHLWSSLDNKDKVITLFDPSIAREVTSIKDLSGFLIYIASPSESKKKLRCNSDVMLTEYFMAPWSKEEVINAWELIYESIMDGLSEQDLLQLYQIWGGSPRILFSPGGSESQTFWHNKLTRSLYDSGSVKKLVQRCSKSDQFFDKNFTENLQWLTHIHTDSSYQVSRMEFPSTYIMVKFLLAIEDLNTTFLEQLKLKEAGAHPRLGLVYQNYVIQQAFFTGVEYSLKSIIANDQETRKVLIANKDLYKLHTNSITHQPNTLYLPVQKNASAIDCVLPPYMFQITRAKSHSIKEEGVKAVKEVFNKVHVDEWFLVWVIPPAIEKNYNIEKKMPPKKLFKKAYILTIPEFEFEDMIEFAPVSNQNEDSSDSASVSDQNEDSFDSASVSYCNKDSLTAISNRNDSSSDSTDSNTTPGCKRLLSCHSDIGQLNKKSRH